MVKEEKEILYEPPRLEISIFSAGDVIATSGEQDAWGDGNNVDSGGWTQALCANEIRFANEIFFANEMS